MRSILVTYKNCNIKINPKPEAPGSCHVVNNLVCHCELYALLPPVGIIMHRHPCAEIPILFLWPFHDPPAVAQLLCAIHRNHARLCAFVRLIDGNGDTLCFGRWCFVRRTIGYHRGTYDPRCHPGNDGCTTCLYCCVWERKRKRKRERAGGRRGLACSCYNREFCIGACLSE